MTDRFSGQGWVARMTRSLAEPSSTVPTGGVFRPLRRFLADRRGVAAIEFGMIMPVMVTLWLGTTELTFASASDRRVAIAANSIADLVARQRKVTKEVVEGIFKGGMAITYPDGQGTKLKMLVTSVEIDDKGNSTVVWSQGHNKAAPADGESFTIDPDLIVADQAGCAVVATVTLKKEVMFLTEIFDTTRTLEHTFAYRPRSALCVEKVS